MSFSLEGDFSVQIVMKRGDVKQKDVIEKLIQQTKDTFLCKEIIQVRKKVFLRLNKIVKMLSFFPQFSL